MAPKPHIVSPGPPRGSWNVALLGLMMGAFSTGPMIQHLRLHNRHRSLVISAVVISVFGFLYFLSHATAPWVLSRLYTDVYSEYGSPTPDVEDFANLVSALWKPYIHDLNNRTYTTDNGRFYEIPKTSHHWSEPMGKDVLILDVDTRPNNPGGHSFGRHSIFDGENMTPRSAGMLNHYIYAQIHGYDYKFVKAPKYKDRHQTWVKVPMIKEALKTHKIVVFLDSDAVFVQPQVPLEWLLSLWNVREDTRLAMAEDPNSPINRDAKGWVLWNTGFVVAQQSERTNEILQAWEECPTDARFPGCRRWARDWAHEQAAFGNYVRYAYNTTDELRAIPCMDGNGAPYIGDKKCGGVFVSHHWGRKKMTVTNLHELVSKVLLRHLQDGRNDLVFDAFVHPVQGHLNKALNDMLLDIER